MSAQHGTYQQPEEWFDHAVAVSDSALTVPEVSIRLQLRFGHGRAREGSHLDKNGLASCSTRRPCG